MEEQNRWVRRADLAVELGVGVRTLVRWAAQSYGPQPAKIGPRAVRYSRAEVDAFLAERQQEAAS